MRSISLEMNYKNLINRKISPIVLILTLILVSAGASEAVANTYFTYVDYPEAVSTVAFGNNPAGDVVGGWLDTQGAEHGFLLRNGTYTSFDFPDALWTEAYGISPRGDIVGQYGWLDGGVYTVHGFLFRKGSFFAIDISGQQNTMPFKISPDGTIVGCNHHNNSSGGTDVNTMMGFSLDPYGTSVLTITRSMNTGVNPDGEVVGYSFLTPAGASSGRAEISYLIRNGVMTTFQFPSAFVTLATDINAAGTIVGRYKSTSAASPFRGFILKNGEFEAFDVPGATQTFPFGISAKGTIVGYYQEGTGSSAVYHGFLLTTRGEYPIN